MPLDFYNRYWPFDVQLARVRLDRYTRQKVDPEDVAENLTDRDAITASVHDMVAAVASYVPGYRLLQEPQFDEAGALRPELAELAPQGGRRMSATAFRSSSKAARSGRSATGPACCTAAKCRTYIIMPMKKTSPYRPSM